MQGLVGTETCRQPIALTVLNRLENLVERAEDLASRIELKLAPICSEPCINKTAQTSPSAESYPTYFSTIRTLSSRLEEALDRIEAVNKSCEL